MCVCVGSFWVQGVGGIKVIVDFGLLETCSSKSLATRIPIIRRVQESGFRDQGSNIGAEEVPTVLLQVP